MNDFAAAGPGFEAILAVLGPMARYVEMSFVSVCIS